MNSIRLINTLESLAKLRVGDYLKNFIFVLMIVEMKGKDVFEIKNYMRLMNKSGEPAHPLYLKADLKPVSMGS